MHINGSSRRIEIDEVSYSLFACFLTVRVAFRELSQTTPPSNGVQLYTDVRQRAEMLADLQEK